MTLTISIQCLLLIAILYSCRKGWGKGLFAALSANPNVCLTIWVTEGHERHSDKTDYIHSRSWQDWTATSVFLCSQEPEKWPRGKDCYFWSKNRNFFFFTSFAVVLIKWTNIFRPAYFTPRHWREGVISLSGQRAEWKESIRWGRRGTETREIEGIQLCVSLSEFREIKTDRWEVRLKNIKKL